MLRPHTILPYFLQTVVMANFLQVLIRAYQQHYFFIYQ